MTPTNNSHQKVCHWHVSVPGEREEKRDAFQNIWITSSQREAYQQLTIMAQGIVEINSLAEHGIQDRLNPNLFLQPTLNTQCNAEMKAFAHQYVPELNRENLMKLSEAVLAHIPYVPAETSVLTSAIRCIQWAARRMSGP